jgi:hypothetical protein
MNALLVDNRYLTANALFADHLIVDRYLTVDALFADRSIDRYLTAMSSLQTA